MWEFRAIPHGILLLLSVNFLNDAHCFSELVPIFIIVLKLRQRKLFVFVSFLIQRTNNVDEIISNTTKVVNIRYLKYSFPRGQIKAI